MGLSSWLEHYLIAEQTTAVSLTLLIYDWTLTLDREVNYIWLQTLTIPKALYFLSRYLPIIAEIFNVIVQSLSQPSLEMYVSKQHFPMIDHESLRPISSQIAVLLVEHASGRFKNSVWIPGTQSAEIFIVQTVLAYRVYALYSRNKRLLGWILFVLLCTSIAATATSIVQYKSANEGNNIGQGIYLCNVNTKLDFQWAYWVPILTFEVIVFAFMVYRSVKIRKEIGSCINILAVLFYDSVIYFVSVIFVSIVVVFIFRLESENAPAIMGSPCFAIMSILANRMLLNIPTAYCDSHK
ncbi:hypothetical protein SISSUDRAFT_1062157 [Sistotremastrum suecicum HHB10207 ss-3]|uniref:DUF6533 domain-containing protein n=1 Tax=Sistotremastrum suecicum HHB10207 ss-3 TaxID=1314776 RepID=A0A166D7W2_9AGAM|nr:hypothetical protein SISSUDRAFT_1062157 [Sistotremastrum suecicum HHB10207 ss-3]